MKLENIKQIDKIDKEYHIIFNDNQVIVLHNKRTILPLLFLIKYEYSSVDDYHSKRYDYVTSVLSKVTDLEFNNDIKDLYNPFSELMSEGFTCINKEREGRKIYYHLTKENHKDLINKRYETSLNVDDDTKSKILVKQKHLCNICYKELKKEDAVLDYIIPLQRGGNETVDNLQIVCPTCFKNKRNRCRNCIEKCDIKNCPIFKEKEIKNIMTIRKMAMKRTK